MGKIKSITIIGRRWFDKTYGNTYHSVAVWADGELMGKVDFAYGYDRQYEQTAIEILQQDKRTKDAELPLRLWAEKRKIILVNTVSDVSRKKYL